MVRASWFDRALASVAPASAARRLAARQGFEMLSRGYEGAQRGKRGDAWLSGASSADAEIGSSGALLRDRSRELTRNNPHAAKALSALVNNIIGYGITPRADSSNAKLNKAANSLFDRWIKQCDADGVLDFYGMQTLACREMVEAGEVLIRRRNRRPEDGLVVPLQLQLLEPDLLDATKMSDLLNGGRIVQGIEFDVIGRRVAYWLHAQHPGDAASYNTRFQSARVPAADVLHVFERQRTQARGVPWAAPAMRTLRDLDDWTFAEQIRKKTEACLVGVVVGAEEPEQGIAPSLVDSAGKTVEKWSPGMVAYMRGGKEITFNQPSATAGVSEWLRSQLHIIAAGYRIPYELLTGDLSQVNYSSIRAGLVEFRRMVDALQWQVLIPSMCQPIWDWFCQQAWAAGALPVSTVPVQWSPPRFEAVDPLKDAQADLLAMRAGTMTLGQAIAKQGYNPDAMLAEIAEYNQKLDAMGIILDSDPRRATKTGVLQAADGEDVDGQDD